MATLQIIFAPGYTATLQPHARAGGAAVGSPISPTVVDTVYTFDLSPLANGDYDMQLSGNWEKNGQKFPCRINSSGAFIADYWWEIDATVATPPIIAPPDVDDACTIQIRARRGAAAIQARVLITCGSTGRLADSAFADIAFDGQTDANGLLQVDLPWSSVSGVGKYRIRLIDIDTGTVFHDRTVTVPDLTTALYEDLA